MIRMIARVLPFLSLLGALPGLNAAWAEDAWTATRTMGPGETVAAEDVQIKSLDYPLTGGFNLDRSPTGLEVKHRIMAGRPLMDRDVGRRAVIRANAIVRVLWQAGAISMELQGKSLQDGAPGDTVRVLNTSSARTLRGVVLADGTVQVGDAP